MILLWVALKRNSVFSKVGSLCGFGVCLFLFKKIAHLLLCGFVTGVRLCHTNVTLQLQEFLAACLRGQGRKLHKRGWRGVIKEIVAPVPGEVNMGFTPAFSRCAEELPLQNLLLV